MDIMYKIEFWNKILVKKYNPIRTFEVILLDKTCIKIKLYINKRDELLDNNFQVFVRNKENRKLLGGIYKDLKNNYKLSSVHLPSSNSIYNPNNWDRLEKDKIIYTLTLTKDIK